MRKTRLLTTILIASMALVTISTVKPVQAQVPGAPAYLHAIADLRMARAYIQADRSAGFDHERRHAIDEITAAIKEIKRAAIDDGKDPDYTPPTDSAGMAAGPLHEALRLVRKAHDDCYGAMDMPNAADMKMRALKHIDEAQDTLVHVMQAMRQY
jgi:hypothetical protein